MGNVFTRETPPERPRTPPPINGHHERAPLQRQGDGRVHRDPTFTASAQRPRKQCRFFAKGRCNKGEDCTFLHERSNEAQEATSPKNDDAIDDSTREFGGAWAEFGRGAATTRVSLPSDFSAIRISNLPAETSAQSVQDLLSDVGLTISRDDVRFTKHTDSTRHIAVVKVMDPSFSKEACRKLGTCITLGDLEVAPIPVPLPKGSNFRQVDCRQVQCSWHRPSRFVFVAFGSKEVASRLHNNLRTGKLKIKGSKVTAEPPVAQGVRGGGRAWMVRLTLVDWINEQDIIQAIPEKDKPRQIEMGGLNYYPDDVMDSTLIQSMLYEFGPLEKWEVSGSSQGRRIKAQGVFLEESHARDAVSALDGKRLPFCKSNKLFVELVTSVRFKVSTRVYDVVQGRINAHKSAWNRQYIHFFAFPPQGSYRVLKLEGRDRESVAKAKQELDLILTGDVMRMDGKNVWYPGFKISGEAHRRLKKIQEELSVVIIRDARSSQFRVFGAEGRQTLATEALDKLIKDTTSTPHFIPLDQEDEFSWALEGGFEAIESQLGRNRAVFDVAARSIVIHGSESDFSKAKLIMARRQKGASRRQLNQETDCLICFDQAEEPIRTSCNHTYCGLCFVNMCQAEASTPGEFRITCEGNSGQCRRVFALSEIRNLLLSETFEDILEASFTSFIRRHPEEFRYCPTPDCSQVYRVTPKTDKLPATFTCGKCLVPIFTACHVAHPAVTCAEHQGDTSGDIQALERTKKELGVQDCPRCGTLMEKTEGCNHMTCQGCKCHICWVCMATFDDGPECYGHMRRLHGGIGL